MSAVPRDTPGTRTSGSGRSLAGTRPSHLDGHVVTTSRDKYINFVSRDLVSLMFKRVARNWFILI